MPLEQAFLRRLSHQAHRFHASQVLLDFQKRRLVLIVFSSAKNDSKFPSIYCFMLLFDVWTDSKDDLILDSRSPIIDSVFNTVTGILAALLRLEAGLCVRCSLLELFTFVLKEWSILLWNDFSKHFWTTGSFFAFINPSQRLSEIWPLFVWQLGFTLWHLVSPTAWLLISHWLSTNICDNPVLSREGTTRFFSDRKVTCKVWAAAEGEDAVFLYSNGFQILHTCVFIHIMCTMSCCWYWNWGNLIYINHWCLHCVSLQMPNILFKTGIVGMGLSTPPLFLLSTNCWYDFVYMAFIPALLTINHC